jgi:hypothetical protein
VIEWARKRGYTPDFELVLAACRFGQLGVLEWVVENGVAWDHPLSAENAAARGHVKVLDWMWEHGTERPFFNCCASWAAINGHVSIFEWLKRRGLPVERVESCWTNAAAKGHVPLLDWLLENGYSLPPNLMEVAMRHGHLDVIQWVQNHQVG